MLPRLLIFVAMLAVGTAPAIAGPPSTPVVPTTPASQKEPQSRDEESGDHQAKDSAASHRENGTEAIGAPVTSANDTSQKAMSTMGKKVLVDDTVSDRQLKLILAKGYRPTRQRDAHEVLYCRNEGELGSRFSTKVCRTATQILQAEQQSKDVSVRLQRPGGSGGGKYGN
jgi:hypothetical protein